MPPIHRELFGVEFIQTSFLVGIGVDFDSLLYPGNKIVTTADSLHIAYRLARVLATLHAPDGALDVGALRSILAKIKDAAHAMRQIKSKATQVEKFAKGINEDAHGAESGILALIEDAERLLETSPLAQTA